MRFKNIIKITTVIIVTLLLAMVMSALLLPVELFKENYSTVVLDRDGRLLGARLADDGQWRFRPSDSVPMRFKTAIVAFEDKYFYSHPGINPISIIDALIDNIKAGKIKRGGSTISMQVLRMSRNGTARTILQKLIESFLAIGLELRYSKDSILNLYCSNAPMGGNIVGLNAASWRYFGHPDHELSWAEAATLAVLPNSPSMIHPGRNRDELRNKRDNLLNKLLLMNSIDSIQYQLAIMEEIPEKVKPIPYVAPHLVEYLSKVNHGEIISTTIDYQLQIRVEEIAGHHAHALLQNGINNAAVLIADPGNKEVLAYVGNISTSNRLKVRGQYNDMVRSKRSTGSILKPFLYAAMNTDGSILPNSLIRDIPSYFNNYHPENYDAEFRGAVPASKALSRSLNVPAVYMLQEYGIPKFLRLLSKLGFSSFNRGPSHYGLSLILGGGEISLYELVGAYTGMAATVLSYDKNYGEYPIDAYDGLRIILNNKNKQQHNINQPLTASSIWLTYDALKKVSRPESEAGWENFKASPRIAWKTGTSHGFKDAWAVGTTANYVIGVWVGNADGEGRSGLTGTKVAAPIMFDIFSTLSFKDRYYPPYDELFDVEVCSESGNLASRYCPNKIVIQVCEKGTESKVCLYHKIIFTDNNKEYRLSQNCANISDMLPVSWFVLPPIQEYYFKRKHPGYKTLPPFAEGCGLDSEGNIDFIYPVKNTSIYVAIDETQKKREIIFEVSHHYPGTTIYWHLDNKLIGITSNIHQLPFIPEKGSHILTVVDDSGESTSVGFDVVR